MLKKLEQDFFLSGNLKSMNYGRFKTKYTLC